MYRKTENDNCVIDLEVGKFVNVELDEVYKQWLLDGNLPEELPPLTITQQIEKVNQECQRAINSKYPDEKKVLSLIAGLYPLVERDTYLQYVNDCIIESNRLSDCITAGTPAIPNWPI